MRVEELKFINQVIRKETLNFCCGSVPSLDELGGLTCYLTFITWNMLSKRYLINFDNWHNVIYNSIMFIIVKEVAYHE